MARVIESVRVDVNPPHYRKASGKKKCGNCGARVIIHGMKEEWSYCTMYKIAVTDGKVCDKWYTRK